MPGGSGGGSADSLRPDSRRNREFLEQFSLDTLRMVGTLRLADRTYGLVKTKDGLVHRVLPGNYMGQADGKVTEISPSKISVVEIVPDGLGGYMERPAALALN
jgi:type IV pilus assembly protein PilP